MGFAEIVEQRKQQLEQQPQQQEQQPEQPQGFAALVANRKQQLEQPVQPQERGFTDVVSDLFTGNDRQTESIQGLPEFDIPLFDPEQGVLDNIKRQAPLARSALGLLTSFDPKRQASVLKDNFPDLKFAQDEKGNIIVDGSEYGGNVGVLNLPGVSGRDLLQAGFQIGAFTPAARAGQAFKTVLGKAGAVAGASGLTQTGQDIVSQSTGSTDFDVQQDNGNLNLVDNLNGSLPKLGDIDKSDVALATVAGGTGEAIFAGLAKVMPILKQAVATRGVTDEVRNTFKQEAVRLGVNPDEVSDDVIRSFMKSTDDVLDPSQGAALQGEKEFGVNLTRGQRSGNQADLSFQDSGRSGVFGGKVQDRFLNNEAQQVAQVNTAREGIQRGLARGNVPISSQQEAGGLLAQGVRQAENVGSDAVTAAYNSVGDASLTGQGYMKLLTAVRDAVRSPEYVKSKTLAPAANELLGMVNGFIRIVGDGGKQVKPQHIKQIELMRRTINSHIGAAANNADKATATAMKRGFDDFMDKAVGRAMFNGNKEALDTLKSSRKIFSEYAKKFRAQPKSKKGGGTIPDKEGNFIENIISGNPTDEQVINGLFGAGNTFGNLAGKNMAVKFKHVLGKNSPEWDAVRQAGFMRMFKPDRNGVVSGTNAVKSLREAMDKNASLMKELYTPEEIGLFRRFATHIKRTQPDLVRSIENPSGTSQKLFKTGKELLGRSMQTLGTAAGNPLLVLSGVGVTAGRGFRNSARAANAVKPFEGILRLGHTGNAIVAAGAGGAVASGN